MLFLMICSLDLYSHLFSNALPLEKTLGWYILHYLLIDDVFLSHHLVDKHFVLSRKDSFYTLRYYERLDVFGKTSDRIIVLLLSLRIFLAPFTPASRDLWANFSLSSSERLDIYCFLFSLIFFRHSSDLGIPKLKNFFPPIDEFNHFSSLRTPILVKTFSSHSRAFSLQSNSLRTSITSGSPRFFLIVFTLELDVKYFDHRSFGQQPLAYLTPIVPKIVFSPTN